MGPSSVPADVFVRSHTLTINQNFHAFIIKTVWLAHVQNVESHCAGKKIACFEEKPLCVTVSIHIILEKQVVVIVINFHSGSEVA
jgi:predicted metal-dependent phosphoesterase TrpH